LQNYDFNVVHRSGGKIIHVNALSRSVDAINELPVEKKLEFLQLSDPEIKIISRRLELEDDDKFALVTVSYTGK